MSARPEESGTLDIAMLHPDWRRDWGRTIAGDDLRAALEADPRLQGRILARIGRAHGRKLTRNPRLDHVSAGVAAALREDRSGFVRLCGLSHIGRRIAMATNAEDFAVLSKAFGAQRLAAAARISASLPLEEGEHGYDSEQLAPAVERMGRAVISEWTATLPRETGDWMTMLLPKDSKGREGAAIGTARAVAIVEQAVAQNGQAVPPTGDARALPPREGSASRRARRERVA